jgi:bifunctional non-homologous end joining protein LigD
MFGVDGTCGDLRKLLLPMREANLERLLARRPEGIFINPFERGEIGPALFCAACRMRDWCRNAGNRPWLAGRSAGSSSRTGCTRRLDFSGNKPA